MYFPLFRGKQNEMLALRDLSERIAQSEQILPIIEPVKINSSATRSLDAFVQANMGFVLIVNPRVGDVANDTAAVRAGLVDACLSEYENYTSAMYVNGSTSG